MSRESANPSPVPSEHPFVVGAYAALGDHIADSNAVAGLRGLQDVSSSGVGFEIPMFSAFPRWSDPGFLLSLDALGSVITLVPALYGIAAEGAGLAAVDPAQRERGVQMVRRAQVFAAGLNDKAPGTVTAITAISGPSSTQGPVDRDALAESLHALTQDDGALPVLIEHCDAMIPGQPAAKGYLPLAEEIDAAGRSGARIALNWGRSAIEGRSASKPSDHLAMAADAGVLGAAMISGASPTTTDLGEAWADVHNPLRESSILGDAWAHAGSSLLTTAIARTWLATAGARKPLIYQGMKLGVLSGLDLHARLRTLRDGLIRLQISPG
ncbi:DUF4862 family protein [Microbacterium sp. NPDC089696]|uniref:DUF4862 family protein n=1 Tax=Microbacterium sp. NPDC089696 TaxID=3364199 RepID=UPI00382BE69D